MNVEIGQYSDYVSLSDIALDTASDRLEKTPFDRFRELCQDTRKKEREEVLKKLKLPADWNEFDIEILGE